MSRKFPNLSDISDSQIVSQNVSMRLKLKRKLIEEVGRINDDNREKILNGDIKKETVSSLIVSIIDQYFENKDMSFFYMQPTVSATTPTTFL